MWHRASAGTNDKRDLWPAFFPIFEAMRPIELFGEQVAGKKVQPWIERARADLERCGYFFNSDTRRASDYGAPQGRERFYFSAYPVGTRRQGLVASGSAGTARPWRWGGEEDLRSIADAPFEPGHSWPEPLVRRSDDGFPTRVAQLRAYGNAIDPWIAAQFIAEARG